MLGDIALILSASKLDRPALSKESFRHVLLQALPRCNRHFRVSSTPTTTNSYFLLASSLAAVQAAPNAEPQLICCSDE
jgi:hypothetical protein